MNLTGPLRGVAVSVVGIAATVVLAVGCSSTTSGNPATASGPASMSISAPGAGTSPALPGASSSAGAPGGSAAAFCAELSGLGLPQVGNPSAGRGLGPVLAKWDRLAATAPAEIKDDVVLVDEVLHGVASGTYPTGKLAAYGTAIQHIASYIAQHCR